MLIGKMMIKLDMGSSISDTSIFCIRNPYRGSEQDEELSDQLEIFWPAKLGKYWRWIDTLRKSNMARGDPPKKEGCWWWETYLGSGTIEYSLFEPPIHAEIQYFTRVSSFCFFRGKDCGSGTFSVVGPTWSKQFPAKIVSRQHNEWTSQAFVKKIIKSHIWLIYHDTYIYYDNPIWLFPSVLARRPYHYFPSGKDVVQRSRFWRVLSSFFVHQSQRMHENACLAIILCII